MITAIILAGSQAWNEDPFESLGPRLLLPIANNPLFSHIVGWLKEAGVKTVTICTNEAGGLLQHHFGDGRQLGIDLYYCEDRLPRGPAGCSRDAAAVTCAEQYVVVEGSVIPSSDLLDLLAVHAKSNAAATVVVNQAQDGHECFGPHLSPGGVYVLEQRALQQVPPTGYQDIKEMLIPKLHRGHELVMACLLERPSFRVDGLECYLAAQGWVLQRACDGELSAGGYVRRDEAYIHRSARVADSARLLGPVMVGPETRVDDECVLIGPTVIGSRCTVGRGCIVGRSVMWDRCSIGEQATLDRCLITSGTCVEAGAAECGVIRGADLAESPA